MEKEKIVNEFPMKLRERTDLPFAPIQAHYIYPIKKYTSIIPEISKNMIE